MADTPPVIIDTHTHVISADLDRYPLNTGAGIANDWVFESPVDAPQLLAQMDTAGVHGAVLVQARGGYAYDNSYVADARQSGPSRLVNAAVIDMAAADRREKLRYWSKERGVLGLRLFNIPPAQPGWLDTADTADVVRVAAADGLRVSACVLSPDLPAVAVLLSRVPNVPIALDHCGFVDLSAGLESPGAQALALLAGYDNVRLKVTTTLFEGAAEAGLDARDVLEWLCAVFGAERLMWGSDYPQYHRESYAGIVAFGRRACSRLSVDEQSAFLGATALKLWPELSPTQSASVSPGAPA
jgi:L-fuconolactonase